MYVYVLIHIYIYTHTCAARNPARRLGRDEGHDRVGRGLRLQEPVSRCRRWHLDRKLLPSARRGTHECQCLPLSRTASTIAWSSMWTSVTQTSVGWSGCTIVFTMDKETPSPRCAPWNLNTSRQTQTANCVFLFMYWLLNSNTIAVMFRRGHFWMFS